LPAEHPLDQYQQRYRLYDWALGELVPLLLDKYPDATAIDIGANVGDTAALLCRERTIPVLCIEAHPRFLPYLRRNLESLPGGMELAECLVGARAGTVPAASFSDHHGTAMVLGAPIAGPDQTGIPVRPLAAILREHPRFLDSRLLKTDTDGSDFEILQSSLDIVSRNRPILYFEYDPTLRPDGARAAPETIAALVQAGYQHFLVQDNFGHFLGRIGADVEQRFAELDRYLFSNLCFGRQIYYYDICAFSAADQDLCAAMEHIHRLLVESALSGGGTRP
jgi:FkbM family methyltransferase